MLELGYIVAQAFATLGTMFPARIVLGVGTGESLNERMIELKVSFDPDHGQPRFLDLYASSHVLPGLRAHVG